MEKSDSLKNIGAALIVFHMKVGNIKKDAKNPFIGNTYASLSNILDVIQLPLSEAGLTYVQFPTGDHGLTTVLIHAESGEYMMADYIMQPVKNDPQGKGSVITYQRRYALSAALGLNVEEDDDANRGAAGKEKEKSGTGGNTTMPWLNENSKEFAGAVQKLKAGTTTIDKIKTVMRLSKAVEAKLIEQSK
jgi:hypothetical protein